MGIRSDTENMSGEMQKRVHLVPTSLDYERVGQIFTEMSPDRVYILYNNAPIEAHEELNKNIKSEVSSIVQSKTTCYERDEVREVGVDFYRFEEALVEAYRLIYRESENGNEVIVNLSGGTKPVAIALAFACSLNDTGIPVYYVAENYNEQDGTVVSSGVAEISFEISPIQLLNMTDIMPDQPEKEEIMLTLLSEGSALGITDILIHRGRIAKKTPKDEEKRSKRSSLQQKYHRYANQLVDDDVLSKTGSEYLLTDTGKLITRLVRVKREVDGQTSLSDF